MTKSKIIAGAVSLSIGLASLATIALANENSNANRDHDQDRDHSHMVSTVVAPGSGIEVTLRNNGTIHASGVKVLAINGNTISGQLSYGTASFPISITTDQSTKFTRHFGGESSINQVSSGDYLAVEGTLVASGNSLTIAAKRIEDNSIEIRNDSFGGTVASINQNASSFVVSTNDHQVITVTTSSTTKFYVNAATATSGQVMVGSVVRVSGLFNNAAKTVVASKVQITVNTFVRRTTFEGTLKSVSASTTPAVLVVTIHGRDVSVNVPSGISIVNNNYGPISLTTLHQGDSLRIYGAVQASNELIIDASIIRDTTSH